MSGLLSLFYELFFSCYSIYICIIFKIRIYYIRFITTVDCVLTDAGSHALRCCRSRVGAHGRYCRPRVGAHGRGGLAAERVTQVLRGGRSSHGLDNLQLRHPGDRFQRHRDRSRLRSRCHRSWDMGRTSGEKCLFQRYLRL